ncbi:flagellar export chaperone FlgN [Neptunicella marina]|uniref:Flagellar export chaperone FlgN n=1 Tax=Neptunicella marina TaxID=2125989 RepID=A0A8J6IWS6_9ALTE|nr:flagellar export chaperone FlgN [Neptunicella marina]MBC3766798.1 flagellar export chaperone FlgN [Neptunicella marina]
MSDMRDALNQQQQQLKQLSLVLENELALISARNADALMKLLEDKESLLNDIAEQDRLIARLYPAQEDKHAFEDDIQLIDKLLEECRYRTDINQKAVEQGQLRLAHLRNMIVESRAKESMTYDKTGQTHSGNKGKGISA